MTPVAICARAPDGAITIATMIPTMHIRAIAHLQNEEPRRSSRLLPLRVPVTMQTPALRGRFATHPTPRASLGCPMFQGDRRWCAKLEGDCGQLEQGARQAAARPDGFSGKSAWECPGDRIAVAHRCASG